MKGKQILATITLYSLVVGSPGAQAPAGQIGGLVPAPELEGIECTCRCTVACEVTCTDGDCAELCWVRSGCPCDPSTDEAPPGVTPWAPMDVDEDNPLVCCVCTLHDGCTCWLEEDEVDLPRDDDLCFSGQPYTGRSENAEETTDVVQWCYCPPYEGCYCWSEDSDFPPLSIRVGPVSPLLVDRAVELLERFPVQVPVNVEMAQALVSEFLHYDSTGDDELNRQWEDLVLARTGAASRHPGIPNDAWQVLDGGVREFLNTEDYCIEVVPELEQQWKGHSWGESLCTVTDTERTCGQVRVRYLAAITPTSPEPERIENTQQTPEVSRKNRFLSFSAGDPNRNQAIRVKFIDLPEPYNQFNGQSMWVGDPWDVTEIVGSADPTPDSFKTARLGCEQDAYWTDWSAVGTIHVHGAFIVPGGEYEIRVFDAGCTPQHLTEDPAISPPLILNTAKWGDVCAGLPLNNQEQWGPPDGVAGITSDVIAVLKKSINKPGLTKARADLGPGLTPPGNWEPDMLIRVSQDVVWAVQAYLAQPYPFPPPQPWPCP